MKKVIQAVALPRDQLLVVCHDGSLWRGHVPLDTAGAVEWHRVNQPEEVKKERLHVRAGVVVGPNVRLQDVPAELLRNADGTPYVPPQPVREPS